jgi:hypothetical protein
VPGRKPFGHYCDEVEIVARMKSLRAAGWGFDRIADRLNADDVPSRSGKSWHGLVVNRILARPVRQIDQPRGRDSPGVVAVASPSLRGR